MTLLINYRPVLRQPTGIGVYARAVLPALMELPHLLIPGGQVGSSRERLRRLAWTQLELPRLAQRQRAELIFTPAPEGYLGRQTIPQVVMVHDLRPISHQERSLQSLYFRSWVPPLLRSCRKILTNSQFTSREIQHCAGVPEERIVVIPLGYDTDVFRPLPTPNCSDERRYFLHVGQAYPHKNLQRLIQAFAVVAKEEAAIQLVLAGKPHPTESRILRALVAELGLTQRVEFRSYVPYAELPDLYRGALALVYPSLWEGFGLPVLEAMACGTPVLTSLGSGTEEVAGTAALLVDAGRTEALIEGLRQLLHQPGLRDQLHQSGLERASLFSWSTTTAATRACLREGIRG